MPANPADAVPLDEGNALAGVRTGRSGHLRWVTSDPALGLQPGDLVLVAKTGTEILATIIVAADYLVEKPPLVPSGQIARLATEADVLRLGDQATSVLNRTSHETAAATAMPSGWSDWIVAPGSPPELSRGAAPHTFANEFIARLFPPTGDG